MSITPAVELRFHPTDLDHATLREALRPAGTPSEAIEAAIMMARLSVITAAKAEVAKMTGEMSKAKLIGAADFAWQLFAPKFIRSLGPVFADQYYHAMKAAGAGEIPMATVYALAEQHAARVGTYYHESSRDALVSGFDTFVNRRMAERVAADRVLDGYGLTARGMAGYTSRALDKAETSTPLKLKQRALDYIGTSVRRRSKVFATQEEHNLNLQAQQIAWMWLQDKGKLTPAAEKVWITARDEKVCPQCGPMHNVRVLLSERFTLPNQTKVYVPGVHPNCRCEVRLLDHPWNVEGTQEVGKAEQWNPKLHPRGGDPENPGRFSAKARTAERPEVRPVAEAEAEDTTQLQRFLDQAAHIAAVEAALAAATEAETKATLAPAEQKATLTPILPKATLQPIQAELSEEKAELGTLAEPKAQLARTDTRGSFMRMHAHKANIQGDTQKAFLAAEQQVKAERAMPKPTEIEVVPTLILPKPVYSSAIDPWEIDDNGIVQITTDTEFHMADEIAVMRQAEDDFNENAWATEDEYVGAHNENNRLTQELDDGTTLVGIVDEDHVHDVMEYAAWQGRTDDPDSQGDARVPVTWYKGEEGPDGRMEATDELVYSSHERASEIAEEWGLGPENFEIPVYVLDEGHNSDLGETVQLEAGTKYGYETWVTSGQYRIEKLNRQAVGSSVPIQFYKLVPVDMKTTKHKPPGFGLPPGWEEDLH